MVDRGLQLVDKEMARSEFHKNLRNLTVSLQNKAIGIQSGVTSRRRVAQMARNNIDKKGS